MRWDKGINLREKIVKIMALMQAISLPTEILQNQYVKIKNQKFGTF